MNVSAGGLGLGLCPASAAYRPTGLLLPLCARLNSRPAPLTIDPNPGATQLLLLHPPCGGVAPIAARLVSGAFTRARAGGGESEESERVSGRNRPRHKDFMKCAR